MIVDYPYPYTSMDADHLESYMRAKVMELWFLRQCRQGFKGPYKVIMGSIRAYLVFREHPNPRQIWKFAQVLSKLEGFQPFRAKSIVAKCNIDTEGAILVHNLSPSDAVSLTATVVEEWGYHCAYYGGGDGRFADTLYIVVEPCAFKGAVYSAS